MNTKSTSSVASTLLVGVALLNAETKSSATTSALNQTFNQAGEISTTNADAVLQVERSEVSAMAAELKPPVFNSPVWRPQDERKYKDLVERYALRQISQEDEKILESLGNLRTRLNDPRKADELLAEWRFRDRVDRLVKLLQETRVQI